jgi:hypothetical protein
LLSVILLGTYISLQQQQQDKSTNWSNMLKSQVICNSSNIAILDAAKYYAKGIGLICSSFNLNRNYF